MKKMKRNPEFNSLFQCPYCGNYSQYDRLGRRYVDKEEINEMRDRVLKYDFDPPISWLDKILIWLKLE